MTNCIFTILSTWLDCKHVKQIVYFWQKKAALHFHVSSRHHSKHRRNVPHKRKLMSCLLQLKTASFYLLICVFASTPSRLLPYLSSMMLCNNFCKNFRMLRNWLKNIVRLFLLIETNKHGKNCCVTLGNFIWVYLRLKSSHIYTSWSQKN